MRADFGDHFRSGPFDWHGTYAERENFQSMRFGIVANSNTSFWENSTFWAPVAVKLVKIHG